MSHVLVVDDDAAIRTVVGQALRRAGHEVTTVETLARLDRLLAGGAPDVLVTDVILPDGDGIDHIRGVAARFPALPIIILSAQNTLTTAVRAAEVGAYEYLPKPFDLDALTNAVAGALARGGVLVEDGLGEDDRALPLIGRSQAMQSVYRIIARVVATDLTVLISGESGTGKELVARAIHDLGPRRAAPFVAINMAAIPRELIEAELFGHERGAFTGAAQRNAGRFEQAAGGTLFLDEIGDMPMEAQTRLLRVLQSGEFTTVGGARTIRTDVRIVAATNRDLSQQVASGQFREDLFYRLNVVPIALPALRERRQDIPLLARHFLENAAAQGLPRRKIDAQALDVLVVHDWPGNVRELENLMRRLAVLARDEVIDAEAIRTMLGETAFHSTTAGSGRAAVPDLAAAVRAYLARLAIERPLLLDDGTLYDRVIGEVERPLIEAMLARHGGNQLRTARAMGINRNTLRKRLDSLNISVSPDEEGADSAT
ncbi:nitrogen regulation protein NR [Sphingomonas sp. S17]|uniref:DNA-binding transcriptional regulator NtrC n=2 Tax=Sphingomonas paucimobilis TaxID=13689 RepID=A0A411LFS3_SPHPI|nr:MULTISPECIES: nitrogen regulation protein NR(I) [Sphingomonas]EGI57017.1 nitrogen regulation protein NR [Sphingomonas sp. S17]MBQ1480003.1 nitrogen regulation protein NR(I) [Sphingomonas sp.]MCM3679094.1 nitrogen regulation protein NR(I) [Sphingomonas paucimobilis]MDG5971848.1 nitrogen regulation protein NR(I) [Sphingomonas paucimobilis]NNG58142.1 nitrogen regulation protein NR(I) [Sphingomonas paucimobilis]